jgi:DNA repair protein RadC
MPKKNPEQFALILEPDRTRRPELTSEEHELVERAIQCLEAKYLVGRDVLTSPEATRNYLKLRLDGVPYEVFAGLFLDNHHRVISYQELFRGTIGGASVHPREVVRAALKVNAAAMIFAHYVARHIMGLMCPVFLCASSGRPRRSSRTADPHQGT